MKIIIASLSIFILLLSIVVAGIFTLSNPHEIMVMIGFLEVDTLLGQALVIAFSAGVFLGLTAISLILLGSDIRVSFLQRELNKVKSELSSMKINGLKEPL